MCHSHVCITGMSLAGVYYIYYVTIYYVNDTTKNDVVLIGCNFAKLPHTAVQGRLTRTLTLTSRALYDCAARARAIGRAVGLPSDVADVDTAL